MTDNIRFTEDMSFEDNTPFIHYVITNETTPEVALKS